MLKLVHERSASHSEVTKRPRRNDARFHYYCVAHRQRSSDRSPVTIYRGYWAYCPHGYGPGHDWAEIEPVTDVDLLRFGPTFSPKPEAELAPA